MEFMNLSSDHWPHLIFPKKILPPLSTHNPAFKLLSNSNFMYLLPFSFPINVVIYYTNVKVKYVLSVNPALPPSDLTVFSVL